MEKCLDLTYEVDARLECFSALLPLRGANFTIVRSNEESGFYLAEEFVGVTADAVVLNFGNLDLAFGVYEESTAVSETFFFDVHTKAACQNTRGVSEHGILDLLDAIASVVPCLVGEVGVGAYRVNFNALGLELFVLFGEVNQFGGAHESEVGGVEEENGPLASDVCAANGLKLAVVVGLNFELGGLCVDDRLHIGLYFECCLCGYFVLMVQRYSLRFFPQTDIFYRPIEEIYECTENPLFKGNLAGRYTSFTS